MELGAIEPEREDGKKERPCSVDGGERPPQKPCTAFDIAVEGKDIAANTQVSISNFDVKVCGFSGASAIALVWTDASVAFISATPQWHIGEGLLK